MGKFVDITGQRFGRLVVQGDVGKRGNYGEILWECLCDCGVLTFVRGYHLKKGRISSCGCYHDECARKQGGCRCNNIERVRTYQINMSICSQFFE